MPTPSWPANLSPRPMYRRCIRCGLAIHPTRERRACRDCATTIQTDRTYSMGGAR